MCSVQSGYKNKNLLYFWFTWYEVNSDSSGIHEFAGLYLNEGS